MRLYKFWKKPESELLDSKYSELYAYTTNKKHAIKFRKERNMNLFYELSEEITKEDYTEITSVMAGKRLDEFSYLTYDMINKKFIHVYVLSTLNEHETVQDMVENGNIMNDIQYVNPFLFKKKYRKVLEKLHYIQGFKIKNPNFCIALRQMVEQSDINDDMSELDDYSVPQFDVDELMLFCKVYGYLFK